MQRQLNASPLFSSPPAICLTPLHGLDAAAQPLKKPIPQSSLRPWANPTAKQSLEVLSCPCCRMLATLVHLAFSNPALWYYVAHFYFATETLSWPVPTHPCTNIGEAVCMPGCLMHSMDLNITYFPFGVHVNVNSRAVWFYSATKILVQPIPRFSCQISDCESRLFFFLFFFLTTAFSVFNWSKTAI